MYSRSSKAKYTSKENRRDLFALVGVSGASEIDIPAEEGWKQNTTTGECVCVKTEKEVEKFKNLFDFTFLDTSQLRFAIQT